MKRKIFIIGFIIALCVAPVFCSSCLILSLMADDGKVPVSTRHSSVVFDFEHLWNMKFPEEFSSAFIFYQRGGWMGEGYFYAIYECEQPNEEFLKDFSETMNEEVKERMTGFNKFYENREYYEEEYSISITLDSSHLPDWEKDFISVSYHQVTKDTIYIGKENCEEYCDDHLYMSYFPESGLLYIVEDIT